MCNIAGYAGTHRAAPILIEMMRREQFIDGGQSTGIATIHEGKLYTAKVLGDVDALLRETDALHFPGTTGIIHSRPAGNLQSHAHPFTDEDGKLALVLNGTLRDVNTPAFYEASNAMMQDFVDRGFTIKSAYVSKSKKQLTLSNGMNYHDSEFYALMIGDLMKKSETITHHTLANAMQKAVSALPADIVILGIHADLPHTITVGDVTRPMVAATVKGETYLATTALAFPEEMIADAAILPLPVCSVSTVTPERVTVWGNAFEGVRVQQIDYRIAARVYERMEQLLKGQKDTPKSLYDFPVYEEWRDLWAHPFVDCKYATQEGLLKPYATVLYEALWSFHRQGRLHGVLGERKGKPIVKFWLD